MDGLVRKAKMDDDVNETMNVNRVEKREKKNSFQNIYIFFCKTLLVIRVVNRLQ